MKTKAAILALLIGCGPALSPVASAHEGPEHEIEELTERIAREGESGDLLLQRAIEYNVLGKAAEAAKDLERAAQFDAQSPAIQRELSRTYFRLGKTNEALDNVSRALKRPSESHDHASLLVVRAEILLARADNQKAFEDTDAAIREHPGNVEWYLLRSQLQARLKLKKERVKGLEEGIKETGAGVLEGELIEAFISDSQHARALATIETELKISRIQSTWLIRRARVRLATGKTNEAAADLQAAVEELNHRITSTAPDPSLLADRGLARELLGDRDDAKKDYESARDKGFTDDWLRDRLHAIRKAEEAEKDAKKDGDKNRKGDKKDKNDPDKDDPKEPDSDDKKDTDKADKSDDAKPEQ